ncbi:MAG: GlsB/YeaQ/YmgE family stress response membrane protein [Thermoanaerobacterales bacterium]|nr:GlsB/YeaQ/YmgE family stress response membrane protein [Thermoanaerobacterales bacterium]
MIGFIIMLIVVGIIAGYVARLLVPGRDPMSFVQTAILGIVGSFVGGFLGYLLFGHDFDDGAFQASGLIGSIIGAVIVLLIYNAATGRGVGRRA